MATIAENLQTIADSTSAIKQAIIDKGGTINGDITTWADAINGISGGGSGGAGSVFKITNKLNGQLFGGPTYSTHGEYEVFHTYTFDGGELAGTTLLPIGDSNGNLFPSDKAWYTSNSLIHSNSSSPFGCGSIEILFESGLIKGFFGSSGNPSNTPMNCLFIAVDTNGNYDIDTISFQGGAPCFLKDTLVTLSNRSTKPVQDITYNDELLVWNFDEGKYDMAKPLWIKKTQTTTYYYKIKLDSGIILNLVGSDGKCHRLFSIEDGMFISATDMVGKTTYTLDGESKVISCELIDETVEFYNIITDYHINLFANGVLTSCRYNNLYPIDNMKFIKDDRLNRAPKWKLYEQFRDHKCLGRYIEGLRLYEQINIPLEETIKYCERLESLRKGLDEFEDNKEIITNIIDTEIGWIDREGNTYGFKTYMPGQYNHIILADKICKELNIETDNTSRYLEKEGWLKYTTNFVINSDDKIVTKKQLETLKVFLKQPNKLQNEGKIRIGVYNSPLVDIAEFENMDEYSFEYRKQLNLKNSIYEYKKN